MLLWSTLTFFGSSNTTKQEVEEREREDDENWRRPCLQTSHRQKLWLIYLLINFPCRQKMSSAETAMSAERRFQLARPLGWMMNYVVGLEEEAAAENISPTLFRPFRNIIYLFQFSIEDILVMNQFDRKNMSKRLWTKTRQVGA